jgi:uncharacterized membrane protein YeaQ/YmgE (transglycosylase-associated protein family)
MMGGLIWWIVVGLIAGWAAGKIMKGKGFGVMWDVVLGIAGAVLGGWLLGFIGFAGAGLLGSIVVAIIGACILIGLSRLVAKGQA